MLGVNFEIKQGGLGRQAPSTDGILGLLMDFTDVPGKLEGGLSYNIRSFADVLELGVTLANNEKLYRLLANIYKINPKAVIWLRKAELVSGLLGFEPGKLHFNEDGGINELISLLSDSNRSIETFVVPDENVMSSSTKAAGLQLFADILANQYNSPVLFITNEDGMYSTFENGTYPNVSMTFRAPSQERNDIVENLSYLAAFISLAKVNESIAWRSKFKVDTNLFSKAAPQAQSAVTLANHNLMKYNFLVEVTGLPGLYFNNSHTCAGFTSDFAYIENTRTMNKARRLLYAALAPQVGSPVLVDATTGNLNPTTVKSFENVGRRALETMISNEEVSAIDVYVNPAQNILQSGELQVEFAITPVGVARKIKAVLGFVNPFNN
jgi:hypothetical protein